MDIKAKTVLSNKKGDRDYLIIFENDSPLGELHDVLFEADALVVQKINEANDQKKAAQEAGLPKVDVPTTDESVNIEAIPAQ